MFILLSNTVVKKLTRDLHSCGSYDIGGEFPWKIIATKLKMSSLIRQAEFVLDKYRNPVYNSKHMFLYL